jgi:hypothetical protein
MKILFLSLLSVAALASEAFAQQALIPGKDVKLGKIDIAGVKTPEYQITGGPQKRSKIGTWLEVEIEFETKPEDIDELTFNYTIMVENKLLDGTVTHVNIPKGRDHFSVMYVSPRSLEKLTGGKALSPAAIQGAWVTVSKQGQVLDAPAAYKPGTQIPNLPHLAGLVLNKGETPFAPLFYDRYEAIKANR